RVHLAAVLQDPARTASVQFSAGGAPIGTATAPASAIDWTAPSVGVDTAVALAAVALDAGGAQGPAATATITVHPDAAAAPQVSLQRAGSGPVFEGSLLPLSATITSADPVASVAFSVVGLS